MSDRFSESANDVISLAVDCALNIGQSYLGTEHLLLALTNTEEIAPIVALQSLGVTTDAVSAAIDKHIGDPAESHDGLPEPTPAFKAVLEQATAIAERNGTEVVPETLLEALKANPDTSGAVILASLTL